MESLEKQTARLQIKRPRGLSQKDAMRLHEETMTDERKQARRYSISTLWAVDDDGVQDELTVAQKKLKELKSKISNQSKRNFLLERDDMMVEEGDNDGSQVGFPDDRRRQLYGNLFFLLQTEPRLVAHLTRLVTLSEMDTLLQTVMFTLYGNQYDSREEHLLLTMFQSVLSEQFAQASDFNSLLRANTPVSRMMTTYTRRGPGQQYLKYVLNDTISAIIEDETTNLEINPLTVYNQMINQIESDTGQTSNLPRGITSDEAAENPDVRAIIKPRVRRLMQIANQFLDTIIDSLNEVPYGIRWICKQIKKLTREKYPESSDWSICSLIGGFFFLRFLNPAVVTPQSYMIVDKQPGQLPRRTLTLVAKMMQNLANKPTYAKEMYMMELNPFVEQNKQRISQFLDDLCQVEDFYESLELDQYMALSKKDIQIQISLNECYNTHQLLKQHFGAILHSENENSFQVSCAHLKHLIDDLGDAPPQLARKDNKTWNLQLFSRWEQAPILFPLEGEKQRKSAELTDSEILLMDTRALLVQLIRFRRRYGHSSSNKVNIKDLLETCSMSNDDPSIVKRAVRARQNLRILEERYKHPLVSRMDDYKQLSAEINQELGSLAQILIKTRNELESLEVVYKTICDHNKYLRQQLESYKAYLTNVRMQSTRTKKQSSSPLSSSSSSSSSKAAKFTHAQLEKDGVITESGVPENRRSNIYFSLSTPQPGSFLIGLHYKERDKPIIEVDLKLDDLLEKQQANVQHIDLEYVQLNVNKTLYLLNKTFMKK